MLGLRAQLWSGPFFAARGFAMDPRCKTSYDEAVWLCSFGRIA
jgi:hypothetical protein